MKIKTVTNSILFLAFGMLSIQATAQKINMPAPSPLQTVVQKFGVGEITIEYSRPSVKDRTIFGDVVPFGKIWRTGANAATKVTFSDDVKLDGNAVKAGTYALYSIPNKDAWEIMLYSDLTLGGNVADYKAENEVVRFKVKANKIPMKIESLMINIGDVAPAEAVMTLLWENTVISFKVTTEIDAKVMKSIDESMKSEKPDYFRAAGYYFDNNKDLKQALIWVDKAVAENPTAFYMFYLKARIEYKLGDKKAGKASAEKTIELAKTAKNDDYIAMANKLLAENK
ncbi:DUF2911 domain-containing protein [Fluviicola taffensis]|uniref:DUF2911 domain-containing protein n=1 Tax=Fluviicola taffensis (strain DSM 16823 / NCIMB 13979 / RW262) TaxID=755732 RepID=F2IA63_FLUTR|nr:DUF2911 domain-containing protein [Fluviicola taffensis]AEA45240.1 hypothetical protein Fluta_3267 [Fluviicola taffensis DSM 16823]